MLRGDVIRYGTGGTPIRNNGLYQKGIERRKMHRHTSSGNIKFVECVLASCETLSVIIKPFKVCGVNLADDGGKV